MCALVGSRIPDPLHRHLPGWRRLWRNPAMMGQLPRRDLWLLPLLSGLTFLVLLMGSEALTRAIWPEQIVNSCRIPDPVFKFRYRPDCTTTMKAAEGPWHTATYNDCGYRSDTSCGPVPAGTRRIALLGASVAEGYMVEFPNTIGARLATDLTAMCDTPVDVQNLGAIGYFGNRLVPRMAEAVKLHPDLAILIVAPLDVEAIENPDPAPVTVSTPAPVERGDLQKRLFETVKESRAFVVAQHFMFRNPALYVPLYLQYGDKADFLRSPFTLPWQTRLQWLDVLVGKLQAEASAAGVPFMIAFIPQEAQVALMAGRYQSSNVQPEALPNAIGAIAHKHGALFADTSVALRAEPKPEQLFYQVDGHLSGEGQPIAAAYLAKDISGALGNRFASCHRPV